MPITVTWADRTPNIILFTFTAPWDVDEFKEKRAEAGELLRSVNFPVHVIADFSANDGFLPTNSLTEFRHTSNLLPWNTGAIYVISSRPTLAVRVYQSLLKLGITQLSTRVYFADSVPDAMARIHNQVRSVS
ncbi:hypothetical protein G4Y79_08530 [Phototrophicus methaneseepsis]|uniref:Uncharacterized protein n=1 Tax=Phototrophicus methaneseepsis TaxID=2710758 RepID=A0A7S8IG73_9CHLR|nr:hypothetical protein [Phototrophicus methaneseepsis]QPC84406.1 hypothetical protein G4Y79_08530 [Phototrophicus methaneseepsis]